MLAALLLAIGLAVPDLRGVLDQATEASPGWLVLAVGLEVASCLGYVAVVRLVLHRAPARDVRRLAWAEMAFGAVVPVGGAGGLAVGAWAMRAWGSSWSRIANRSAVIFLLTSAVNGAVLVITGLGVWVGIGSPHTGPLYGLLPAAGAAILIGFFLALPTLAVRLGPDAGKLDRSRDESDRGSPTPSGSRSRATGACSARPATCCSTLRCCGRV